VKKDDRALLNRSKADAGAHWASDLLILEHYVIAAESPSMVTRVEMVSKGEYSPSKRIIESVAYLALAT
jgi:hypothetical protein